MRIGCAMRAAISKMRPAFQLAGFSFAWVAVAFAPGGAQAGDCHPRQIARLVAADGQREDRFGGSVALAGDTALVGAYRDDHGWNDSGSAYVFRITEGIWQPSVKLTPSDAAADDRFGASVSLSGNTALIGAPGDDDAGSNSGSAYIFREIDGTWQQVVKLRAADMAAGDSFGTSVALVGATAVVGAWGDDDAGSFSGSAYVFREIGGVWTQIAKLSASDAAFGDWFGYSVALDGETAIVGAVFEGGNISLNGSGAAYVFREMGGVWQEVAKLAAADAEAGDAFGRSVAIVEGAALVGAFGDNPAGPGGGAAGGFGDGQGAAYIFREVDGVWRQIAKLTASDAAPLDNFGWSVAFNGSTALVGALSVNGDGFSNVGAAYSFREIADSWQEVAKFRDSDLFQAQEFGSSVALDGDAAIVGAWGNGSAGADSGAAYLFDLQCGGGNLPGDLDGDGSVDLSDLALLLSDFGCGAAPCTGDVDGDGDTDLSDLAILLGNFGI